MIKYFKVTLYCFILALFFKGDLVYGVVSPAPNLAVIINEGKITGLKVYKTYYNDGKCNTNFNSNRYNVELQGELLHNKDLEFMYNAGYYKCIIITYEQKIVYTDSLPRSITTYPVTYIINLDNFITDDSAIE